MSREKLGISTGKAYHGQETLNEAKWIDVNNGEVITLDIDENNYTKVTLPTLLENGKTYIFKIEFRKNTSEITPGQFIVKSHFITFTLSIKRDIFESDSSAWLDVIPSIEGAFLAKRYIKQYSTDEANVIRLCENNLTTHLRFYSEAVRISYAELC